MARRTLDYLGITRPAGSKLYPAPLYAVIGVLCVAAAIVGLFVNFGVIVNGILLLLAAAMFIVFFWRLSQTRKQ